MAKRTVVAKASGPIHRLVASSNSGRFALDCPDGCDLTSGNVISILLGGQWIDGCVEHDRKLYPQERALEQIMREIPMQYAGGYYFIANDGNMCGLCVGMRVQVSWDEP
jgi:hypothetical protein